MVIQNTDAIFKFNIADITDNQVTLTEGMKITLKIQRREFNDEISSNDFECSIDMVNNVAYVLIEKEYFTTNTTHQFQLEIVTEKGSTYRSHLDSFFVCEGI